MPMGRISDDLCTNKKVRHLLSMRGGREAIGLWLVADSWCNKELTDGAVPAFMVEQLGWKLTSAERLVEAGLWSKTEHGFLFHDWEDFNERREDVLRKRAQWNAKQNNVRGAERSKKAYLRSLSPGDTQGESPGVSPGVNVAPDPDPDPSSLRSEEESASPNGSPPSPPVQASLFGAPAAEPSKAPAKEPKEPTAAAKAKQALRAAVDRLSASYGHEAAPAASKAHWATGAGKVTGLVDAGAELDVAADRVAKAALDWLRAKRSSTFGYSLQDCLIGPAAVAVAGRPGRLVPARANTAEDFEGDEDIADVMARWNQNG